MKVQTNFNSQLRTKYNPGVKAKPAFRAVYSPKNYTKIRSLSDYIYENSKGPRKILLAMYKNSGEMLNNWVTFFGTAAVAPIFIAFNPISKEDKNSKEYTALRQPISGAITILTQFLVMSNFNKMLDRHAALFGIDEIDLAAKPPKTVLIPKLKHQYREYAAACTVNGTVPLKKKDWINARVREIQDKAFYKTLDSLRDTMDDSKLKLEDLVKLDALNEKRNSCYKDVLKDEFGFKQEALDVLPDYDTFRKKFAKKICKVRELDFNAVFDKIDARAMELAKADMEHCIDLESKVKLQTSIVRNELLKKLKNAINNDAELLKYDNLVKNGEASEFQKQEFKNLKKKLKSELYQNMLDELKPDYDKIIQIPEDKLTDEQIIKKDVYEKLKSRAHNPIDELKDHGLTLESARKRVKIKKYLINKINRSEAKFKGFKDRAGVIVGLLILPATCGILNWAYPRIMEKLFPKLSAAKAASKEEKLKKLAGDSNNNAKEVK